MVVLSARTLLEYVGFTHSERRDEDHEVIFSDSTYAYSVTENGEVFRIYKSGRRKRIALRDNKHGYYTVNLKGHNKCVHRMVAFAFLGDAVGEKTDVNHKDGNKKNNSVGNLEWCTRSENRFHAHRVLGWPSGNKGKKASLESRRRMSLAHKGLVQTEEAKANSRRGVQRYFEELRRKGLKPKRSKKVVCNETGIVYDRILDAANAIGRSPSILSHHLSDKHKPQKVRGFTFSFFGGK